MPNNNYNLQIGAILNTKDLEQTLKNEKAQLEKSDSTKIKWRLDTGQLVDAIKVVKQFNSEIGKIKQVKVFDTNTGKELEGRLTKVSEKIQVIQKETNQYTNSLGQLVTQVRTVDEAGQALVTETIKYTNAQGQQIKSTKTLIEENGQLVQKGREVLEINQMLAETTTTTNQYLSKITDTINGVTRTYDGLVTTITKVDSNGQTVVTRISEYITATGQAVKVTETLDGKGNHIATTQRQVSDATDKANKSIKNFGNSATNASKSTNTLNWSLTDAFRRLANFYLASLPIRAFQTAITNAVQAVKDFDAAITEMGKVSDYSGDKLRKYTQDLADLGTEVARTQTEMTEAATGWLKAGYSEEDAALLSKFSALLQNTADEELSAADATSILVSQLKAYHMEADEAIKVTDIINKVSANQAVSSGDIAKGLTVASAAMATFGNNIEQTTALLTAGTTIFQGRSQQVARGLNMIATRVAKNEKELAKYGVSINDANGELRSTYDILVDLAPAWNNMSKAEQVALGNTLAGTNQYKILAAIMSQMDVAIESYDQALNSSGETMKQNAVYMDSLEAKTTALKAEFEKLVIGEGGLQDTAKWFVELGTSILTFVNNAGGLPTVLLTITSLLIGINTIKIGSWITDVLKGIKSTIMILPNAINAWKSYILSLRVAKTASANMGTATTSLSSAMQASIPIIGLVVAAIGLVVSQIIKANQEEEALNKKVKENIATFADEYKALEDSQKKLKDENISREELNSIIDSNLDEYEAERLKLLDINDARKEAISLIEEEKKTRAQEIIDTGLSSYEESLDNLKNGFKEYEDYAEETADSIRKKVAEQAGIFDAVGGKEQIEALKKYKQVLLDIRSTALKRGEEIDSSSMKALNKDIKNTESLISELGEKYKEDTENVRNFNSALKIQGKYYDEYSQQVVEGSRKSYTAIEEERKGKEKLGITTKKTIQQLDDLKQKYEIAEQEIYDYIEAHQEENATYDDAVEALALEAEAQSKVVKSTEALNEEYKDALDATSSLVSEMSNLSSAFEEQEKNGSLSLSTQLKLIEAGYALALTYDKETGACKLDEEAVKDLVKAKLEMQIANLECVRSELTATLTSEANAAVVSASAFLDLAKAKNVASKAYVDRSGADPSSSIAGWGGNAGYLKNDTTQVDALNKEIEALERTLGQVGKSGISAFKSISGGAKSAKNATDDAKKAAEDLKAQYEKVISWITKQYDKKIDSIKDAKDAVTDAIEKEIKALEKEKDTIIDGIEDKKDALQDERDAIVDGLEAEIDALEKSKEARQKYWDEQIDALKKANDARKDAIELQEKLDALERARNTKVKIYKEGQGFVYDVDQTKVAEAQKALDEYLSEKAYEDELARLEALKDAELNNYKDRIDALKNYKDATKDTYDAQIKELEKYKDALQKNYDEQLDALKDHKEAVEAEYDAEIEIYENYKQQFEDMVNAYEEEQNKLLAQQLTGIDFENDNWMTRLDNLAEFVRKYNELQKQLNTGNTSVTNDASMKSGGSTSSGSKKSSTQKYDDRGYQLNENFTKTPNTGFGTKTAYVPTSVTNAISQQKTGKKSIGIGSGVYHYASGIGSIKDDEIAIVGENPNKEIVLGSKVNNGELMALGKGAGVVNADSSSTLASMLNQVGKYGSSGFGSGNGTLNNNINNDSLTINGVTIEGSQINDPQTFVNGLLNLKSEALQRAYKHR